MVGFENTCLVERGRLMRVREECSGGCETFHQMKMVVEGNTEVKGG